MGRLATASALAAATFWVFAAPPGAVAGPRLPASSPPDTVARVWGTSVTASSGGLATVAVRLDLDAPAGSPGRVRCRVRFGPSLLAFEGYAPGNAGGELTLEPGAADSGVLAFEVDGRDGPSGLPGRSTLLELTFRVMAPPGGVVPVALELEVLEAAGSGADLLDRTEVRNGTVLVR